MRPDEGRDRSGPRRKLIAGLGAAVLGGVVVSLWQAGREAGMPAGPASAPTGGGVAAWAGVLIVAAVIVALAVIFLARTGDRRD